MSRNQPKQRRSRERLDAILDAAARLVAHRPVASISLMEIGEEAGIPKSSLYQYFESRDDVFEALASSAIGHYCDALKVNLSALSSDSVDAVTRTAMETFVAGFTGDEAAINVYLRSPRGARMTAFSLEQMRGISNLIQTTLLESGLPVDLVDTDMIDFSVRVGDLALQAAFAASTDPDVRYIETCIDMIVLHCEQRSGTSD